MTVGKPEPRYFHRCADTFFFQNLSRLPEPLPKLGLIYVRLSRERKYSGNELQRTCWQEYPPSDQFW